MLDQTHALLSEEAVSLGPDTFAQYLALAQDAYGIQGLSFSTTDEPRVDRALALQVNLMLSKGIEGESEVFQSLSRGERSWTFRERMPEISRPGLAIIRSVLGPAHGFSSLISSRTNRLT